MIVIGYGFLGLGALLFGLGIAVCLERIARSAAAASIRKNVERVATPAQPLICDGVALRNSYGEPL